MTLGLIIGGIIMWCMFLLIFITGKLGYGMIFPFAVFISALIDFKMNQTK